MVYSFEKTKYSIKQQFKCFILFSIFYLDKKALPPSFSGHARKFLFSRFFQAFPSSLYLSWFRSLLRLLSAPLPGVLVGRRLVDVTENNTNKVQNIYFLFKVFFQPQTSKNKNKIKSYNCFYFKLLFYFYSKVYIFLIRYQVASLYWITFQFCNMYNRGLLIKKIRQSLIW